VAIDSAAKRRSISGAVLPFLIVGITPDATPGVDWRQTAGWSYQGVTTVSEPLPTNGSPSWRVALDPDATWVVVVKDPRVWRVSLAAAYSWEVRSK